MKVKGTREKNHRNVCLLFFYVMIILHGGCSGGDSGGGDVCVVMVVNIGVLMMLVELVIVKGKLSCVGDGSSGVFMVCW